MNQSMKYFLLYIHYAKKLKSHFLSSTEKAIFDFISVVNNSAKKNRMTFIKKTNYR